MKKTIVIAGGTGLIGSRLIELLDRDKYDIYILSRSIKSDSPKVKYIRWNPDVHECDLSGVDTIYALINLAGAGIADKPWTKQRKEVLITSRTNSVITLSKAVSKLTYKVQLYLASSAIGIYGDRGDEVLTEASMEGTGFLAEICRKWEKTNMQSRHNYNRSVLLRIGIVLSSKAGALKEILSKSKFGMYAFFGNGSAYYSWIHIDDLCRIMIASLMDQNYEGIYNACAEKPVRIKKLIQSIVAAKSGQGVSIPVPAFMLKLILGDLADMLLSSICVIPQRLLDQNFEFSYKNPEAAIKNILSNKI